ncbi:MAG: hypothetical protein JO227_22865 [Acetobacteraceae bacterium]|nr:hypothetical protein [Acetobacteraceae bacterium]
MLRYLLAGLVTIAGVVLLFAASLGDATSLMHRMMASLPTASLAAPQHEVSPPPAPSPTAPDAAQEQQRQALEHQLQELRATVAAAAASVATLRSTAEQEQKQIATLQQRHAEEAAQLQALKNEQAAEALRKEPAATAAQVTPSFVPQPQPRTKDIQPEPARETPAEQASRPKPAPVVARAEKDNANSPKNSSSAADLPRQGAQQPVGAEQAPVEMDTPSARAVLSRLRRQPQLAAKTAESDYVDPSAVAPRPLPQPAAQPARDRLGMARAALVAGHIDEAHQLLEQAQLQLVFRPVAPAADEPRYAGHAASDVGQALSMLGAGNRAAALQFIDRAMAGGGGSPPLHAVPPQMERTGGYDYSYGYEGRPPERIER